MFKGNIGTRTGRNVLEGKEIHCDSAGFDNFDNYFTDSASSSPEKSIDTVRQNAIKSFLNAEKTVQDGESPLSKLPSKKRLSFKADATSDSDSSSITSFQPRNRLISKRGMQSFPGEDEEEEKKSLERFSPLIVPFKTSSSPGSKVYLPHSHSETKYTKRISKRGMKSFPDDDIDDDLQAYEIVNSPDYLNVEPIIVEKMVEDEQQNLSPNGGKENEENLSKIQNYENTKQLHQKSYSHVSSATIKVNTKPGEKTAKSMNWYIWEDNSLTDRAKIIITPYGVHEDTGIKNNFQNMGTNLQVIDEDESQPPYKKNWKSKLPHLDICENSNVESSESTCEKETAQEKPKSSPGKQTTNQRKSAVQQTMKKLQGLPFSRLSLPVNEKHRDSISEAEVLSEVDVVVTDEVISIDEKSLPKSEESSKNEVLSSDVTTSTDEERQKLKRKKRVAVPKLRVSPRRQRTSLRTKSTSPKTKVSPAKRSLGSMGTKFTPFEEKRKSTTSSTKNKQALPVSKMNVSPSQNKKSSSNLRKRKVSSSQENKPVETRKRKRTASSSPKNKIPAKRAKINEPTIRTSNHWTRSSTSKVKKESISPAKKQNKTISQKPDKVDTSSEQCLSVSPSNIIMPLPSINPSESTQDMPDNHSLLLSETENFEAISLGFNSPPSNFNRKDADLSSKGSDKINSSTNSNDKLDIFKVFDSKELNPKLDKPNEKNKNISSLSQSNAEDVPKMPLQKHEEKRSSTTSVTIPRKRRTSGPLSSEDSLVICNKEKRRSGHLCEEDSLVAFSQGYSKRISAEKSKSPAKTNHVTKDLNVSNLNSHEGPSDWLCQGCNGLIPQCLMTCIFCGFRRQSHEEDPNESDNDSQEGTTDWQCQGCEGLIPASLKACIFCGLCKQEGSQGSETQMSQHRNSPSSFYRKLFKQLRGKNKPSPQNSKKGQKALSEPVDATSKYESPALQKTSLRSMKKQSSFTLKSNYTFNSYTDIKVDHKISYCVCSQSDTAVIGMMKLQRGGYRNPNQSLKEMFFTVLEGQVRVQIDSEKQELSIHDTFVVAKNGEYSIENTSAKTACLIFTIIK